MVADGAGPRVIAQRLEFREIEVRASLDSTLKNWRSQGALANSRLSAERRFLATLEIPDRRQVNDATHSFVHCAAAGNTPADEIESATQGRRESPQPRIEPDDESHPG
jgi:hypothetical protein